MQVELFDQGKPTGRILLLQIKGTTTPLGDLSESIAYDVPVKTARYSELFIAPILVVLCPVEETPARFFFVWLQEYIRVVLNHENPTWRGNKKYVRVPIPRPNRIPGPQN